MLCCRLLFGTLEVTGYDLVEPVPQSRQQSGNPFASMFKKPSLPQFVARQVVGVRVVAPAAPLVLFPNEGDSWAPSACVVMKRVCHCERLPPPMTHGIIMRDVQGEHACHC